MSNVIKFEKPKSELIQFLEQLEGVTIEKVYERYELEKADPKELSPGLRRIKLKFDNEKNRF